MQQVDVLVFGPHADDVEIGLAGTIARHTAEGLRVGICDLTRAELSSNGTPDERLAEAQTAAAVLGAAWRDESRMAGRRHRWQPAIRFERRSISSVARARVPSRSRTGPIGIPIMSPPARCCVGRSSRAACGATKPTEPFWQPEWVCHYFINDSAPPSFVVDVSAYYEQKRAALACYRSQFATGGASVSTRLNSPTFGQLVESRDAQFGALAGVAYAEGLIVREPIVRPGLLK